MIISDAANLVGFVDAMYTVLAFNKVSTTQAVDKETKCNKATGKELLPRETMSMEKRVVEVEEEQES